MNNSVENIYGLLPVNWRMVRLSQLVADGKAELQTGPFGTMLHASAYRPVGTPVIAVQHIGENKLKHEDLPRLDDETVERLARYKVCENDILFGRKGAVDRRALVRSEEANWIQGSDCIRLRFTDEVDARFVSYVFGSDAYRQWIIRHAQGATMPSLNQEILGLIPLPLPPLTKQKAIAAFLEALDDKIELNRRMNGTLETMARALFQRWFVDFDPVRAKLGGHEPTGLDKATALLFPSSFQDSPSGDIPSGWETGSILRQADLLSGGTPKTDVPAYWGGDVPWASAKDVSQCGEAFLVSTERMITNLGVEESATKIIPVLSTVVVARGATTGRLTMLGDAMAMNQTCYGLRSKVGAPFALYCHARDFMERLVLGGHGSIFDTITTSTFEATTVLLAPKEVLLAFDERVAPLFRKIRANLHQSRTLATLRDTLLPKLLSGELSIAGVEKEFPL